MIVVKNDYLVECEEVKQDFLYEYREKKKFCMVRVSGKGQGQGLQTQIERLQKFIAHLSPEEYEIFYEYGVSAYRLGIKQRPEHFRMCELIKQDLCKELLVLDRSRIARNFYEYLEFVELVITHGVKVTFTTEEKGYTPFVGNLFIEGFYGMFVQEEGRSINYRSADGRKVNSAPYGFEKQENDKGNTFFTPIVELRNIIENFFEAALHVTDHELFLQFLNKHVNMFSNRRELIQLVKYLTDARYAGYNYEDGKYYRLDRVEPIITLDLFKSVQKNLQPFIGPIRTQLEYISSEIIYTPTCSSCGKKMKYNKSRLGKNEGSFTCRCIRKELNSILISEFNEILGNELLKYISNLNVKELDIVCRKEFLKNKNSILEKQVGIKASMDMLIVKIASQKMYKDILDLSLLEQYGALEAELGVLAMNLQYQYENEALISSSIPYMNECLIKELEDASLTYLTSICLKECTVSPIDISFEFYFSKFIEKEG